MFLFMPHMMSLVNMFYVTDNTYVYGFTTFICPLQCPMIKSLYGSSRALELDHADEHAPVHAADQRKEAR